MNTIVAMSFYVSQRVEHYQAESAKSHLEPNESELAPVGVCAAIGAFLRSGRRLVADLKKEIRTAALGIYTRYTA